MYQRSLWDVFSIKTAIENQSYLPRRVTQPLYVEGRPLNILRAESFHWVDTWVQRKYFYNRIFLGLNWQKSHQCRQLLRNLVPFCKEFIALSDIFRSSSRNLMMLLWKNFESWMDPLSQMTKCPPGSWGCLGIVRLKFHLLGGMLKFLVIMVIVSNITNHY